SRHSTPLALPSPPTRRSSDLAANHGQAPDPDKLVHPGHTTQHRLIFHCHHAGEANALGKDHVIAHHAVVADVHHGHHVVVAADRSEEHTSELQSRENVVFRLL